MQQLFTVLTKIVYYACFDVDLFRFDIKWRPVSLTELGNEEVSVLNFTMNTRVWQKKRYSEFLHYHGFFQSITHEQMKTYFLLAFHVLFLLDDEYVSNSKSYG